LKFKDWHHWLSDLFILAGFSLLLFVCLFWVRTALAAQQIEAQPYLISTLELDVPLPTPTATPFAIPTATPMQAINSTDVADSDAISSAPELEQSDDNTARKPTAGRITWIDIPRLDVKRAVVPLKLINNGKQVDWNTDALFATRNRPDLVGHLVTSVNPGDGGNIVLAGHNYNNGGAYWNGVFVNLKKLKPGDTITVSTENGEQYSYLVQKVKQVPWTKLTKNELEKHQKYFWPTPHEQLTLITCGGTNLWSWSARVYVVAFPSN